MQSEAGWSLGVDPEPGNRTVMDSPAPAPNSDVWLFALGGADEGQLMQAMAGGHGHHLGDLPIIHLLIHLQLQLG